MKCTACSCPEGDHIALRYWFRCWRRHQTTRLGDRIDRLAVKLDHLIGHIDDITTRRRP